MNVLSFYNNLTSNWRQ